MRILHKIAFVSAIALVAFIVFGKSNINTIHIDDHKFRVPNRYIVNASVFYLPHSQDNGLNFYVNPESPLRDRMIVGIESATLKCPIGVDLDTSPLASTCRAAAKEANADEWKEGGELEKLYSNGDSTPWDGKPTPWWNYRIKYLGEKNPGTIIATCANDLCQSYGSYRNLVYSIGFNDSEIKNIYSIHHKVRNLLSAWEQASH